MNTEIKKLAGVVSVCAVATVMLVPELASAVTGAQNGVSATLDQGLLLGKTVKAFMFTMAQIVGSISFLVALFLWKKRIDAGEQGASQHPWGKILATAGFGIVLFMAGTLFEQGTNDIGAGKGNTGTTNGATYKFGN